MKVPSLEGGEVQTQQPSIPSPQFSAPPTDAFGGKIAEANAAGGKAIQSVGEVLSNHIAKQQKLDQRMATVGAISDDSSEILRRAYDPTPIKVKYKDISGNEIEKEIPSGPMLRKEMDATLDNGSYYAASKAVSDVTNARLSKLSADDAAIYQNGIQMRVQSLLDKAAAHEATQKESSIKKRRDSTLGENVANDPLLPLAEKAKLIDEQGKLFSEALGEDPSVAKDKRDEYLWKSAKGSIMSLWASRTGDTEDAKKVIEEAKGLGLSNTRVADLEKEITKKEISDKLAEKDGMKNAEEAIMKDGVKSVPQWIFGLNKKLKMGVSGEEKFDTQINKINSNPNVLEGNVTTDKATRNDLRSMMVDTNIPDDQKRLATVTALAEAKLNKNELATVSDLYFLPVKDKQLYAVGIKGVDEWVKNYSKGDPSVRETMTSDFITNMQNRKPDESMDVVFNRTKNQYLRRTVPSLAHVKDEDMPHSTIQMQGGHAVLLQNLGDNKTSKKADIDLTPKKPSGIPDHDPKTQKLQRNKTTGEYRVVPK